MVRRKGFSFQNMHLRARAKARAREILGAAVLAALLALAGGYRLNSALQRDYAGLMSAKVYDRNAGELAVRQNSKGYYVREIRTVPPLFKDLLVRKEDRFFYFHPGVNPLSVLRDLGQGALYWRLRGSSTLTQQLVKILLGNENDRTLKNKLKEAFYALSLDLFTPKDRILTMYANAAYFGNQAQGLGEAANYYYRVSPEALTTRQTLELLGTLNNPSNRYPGTRANQRFTERLADILHIGRNLLTDAGAGAPGAAAPAAPLRRDQAMFELQKLGPACPDPCAYTVDRELNEKLRTMLARNLDSPALEGVDNGAIVVIRLSPDKPYNELLALVGSPDPASPVKGRQINMAVEPRPVGSTAKPFIYAAAFEQGARPYTLVDDREYQYAIGTGFAFYPKNYDGKYRGLVTLHQALANSLNVPTVKTLEFVGLERFASFFQDKLGFEPRQPLETYQLGIALGGLEMDPLTLTDLFTVFPGLGTLKPLKFADGAADPYLAPPMLRPLDNPAQVLAPEYAELINKVLSDRDTGVDQFGIKSNLNLTQANYAVKTGTTYDYHDSWTVGYTPDFAVGVWLGNSDNKPIRQISGQAGAGKVWHDAMEIMFSSPYNRRTEFAAPHVQEVNAGGNTDYGLAADDYAAARSLLLDKEEILMPHHGDVYLLQPGMTIPLRARDEADWYVDGRFFGRGQELDWHPVGLGTHSIEARGQKSQRIKVLLAEEE